MGIKMRRGDNTCTPTRTREHARTPTTRTQNKEPPPLTPSHTGHGKEGRPPPPSLNPNHAGHGKKGRPQVHGHVPLERLLARVPISTVPRARKKKKRQQRQPRTIRHADHTQQYGVSERIKTKTFQVPAASPPELDGEALHKNVRSSQTDEGAQQMDDDKKKEGGETNSPGELAVRVFSHHKRRSITYGMIQCDTGRTSNCAHKRTLTQPHEITLTGGTCAKILTRYYSRHVSARLMHVQYTTTHATNHFSCSGGTYPTPPLACKKHTHTRNPHHGLHPIRASLSALQSSARGFQVHLSAIQLQHRTSLVVGDVLHEYFCVAFVFFSREEFICVSK